MEMEKINDLAKLGEVLEPYDPAYISGKAYQIPDISSAEKKFIRKVSILENRLRKAHVRFRWHDQFRCFYVWKYKEGSEYPTYRYVRVNIDENDYSFGTEDEDLVFDGKVSVVVKATVDWLNIVEKRQVSKYVVVPINYHKGYCQTTCYTLADAEKEVKSLSKKTGFNWTIRVVYV